MPEGFDGETLRYPLYLDVPMMVSFLATIEDGISYEANVQTRTGSRRTASGSGELAAKGPSVPPLASLFSFDLRGKLTAERGLEESEELQVVRQHTEASLFNRLRNALHGPELDAVVRLSENTPWDSLRIGELVELTGELIRNPLAEILAFYTRLVEPMMQREFAEKMQRLATEEERRRKEDADEAKWKQKTSGNRVRRISGASQLEEAVEQLHAAGQLLERGVSNAEVDEAKQQEQIMQVVALIRDDVQSANMQDMLLHVTGEIDRKCIVTLTKGAGFNDRPLDDLLGSELVVLGKVTKVLREDEAMNLLRRSPLGFLSEARGNDLMDQLKGVEGLNLRLDRIIIKAPAIQILPMAIFA